MATPTSSVEICNLALDLLRHKDRVTSIETPTSDTEAICSRWYDLTRRSLLRNFPFNFARDRAVLSRNATAPEFGYADAYDLPSDYLELLYVGDNYDDDYEIVYHIENNQLLIDNGGGTSINIGYVKDAVAVNRFDALFLDLFVAELAVRMSNSLTGINKSMKELKEWKESLEKRARSKNGHENPPRVRYRSPLINARRQVTRSAISDGQHLFSQ